MRVISGTGDRGVAHRACFLAVFAIGQIAAPPPDQKRGLKAKAAAACDPDGLWSSSQGRRRVRTANGKPRCALIRKACLTSMIGVAPADFHLAPDGPGCGTKLGRVFQN